MRSLHVLSLKDTQINDDGNGMVPLLTELPNLVQLSLQGTKVSVSALQKLVCEAIPGHPFKQKGKLEVLVMPCEQVWKEYCSQQSSRYFSGHLADPCAISGLSESELKKRLQQLQNVELFPLPSDAGIETLQQSLFEMLRQQYADTVLVRIHNLELQAAVEPSLLSLVNML